MKRLIVSSLIVLACTPVVLAKEVVREISWKEMKDAGKVISSPLQRGAVGGPEELLMIENPETLPRELGLLLVEQPKITGASYAITGQVRYEHVDGRAYLEMMSIFPGNKRYFSRTLADSGLMKHLEGSSDWRPFSLPFILGADSPKPSALALGIFLPGRGTVHLGPLQLVQYDENEDPFAIPGATGVWWTGRTAGLIGGIFGSVLGCLGGLIGTLGGMGKARRFTLGLVKAICLLGLLLTVAGIVALFQSQPYAVWYPLLLLGILGSAIMGGLLPVLRRRYEQVELRKMTAADAAVL